ncbi:MAG: hypothetical protein HZB91_05215 [Elusimicrobia bacterium]|nr:hypothetical protein [Elusimicrobiota bacterium]
MGLLIQTPAFAAAPPQPTGAEEAVGRRAPTTLEEQSKERKAAEAAAMRKAVEGDRVTYQQVLADPDNIDLNYRFARTQIASGDVKGAAATLERILMVDPGLHKVRLLYALALFRLDNLNEAEREINALTGLTLPANLQAELEEYKKLISKRRRSTHLDVTLGFGFDVDSNRSATPGSEQLMFANQFIAITPANPDTSDTAMIGLGSVRVTHDPGTQAGHEVIGGFGWYRAEQTLQDKLDLQVFSLDLGTALKFGRINLTPRAYWDQVYLSEEVFLERPSIGMKLDHKLNERLSWDFEAKMASDIYSKTSEIPRAEERTGPQWDLALGVNYVATPVIRLRGGYTLTDKDVIDDRYLYNAFNRHALNVSLAYLLGKGMFLMVSGAMDIDSYDKAEALIGNKVREDVTFRPRITFGTPLGFIHKYFKDFTFTQTYEYYRAESNITNYAYDNNKLSSLVTYKWGW